VKFPQGNGITTAA